MWGENWGDMIWGGQLLSVPTLGVIGLGVMAMILVGIKYWGHAMNFRHMNVVVALIVFTAGLPYALAVTLPHKFSNGQVADADQVNENFEALREAVGILEDAGDSPLSSTRYFLEAFRATSLGTSIPVDHTTLISFCADEDGCTVRFCLSQWDANNADSCTTTHFHYRSDTSWWRSGSGPAGVDGNNATNHIINSFGTCYFTDGIYSNFVDQRDTAAGLNLLVWNGSYNYPDLSCKLIIDD